jgi:hypothetical protein
MALKEFQAVIELTGPDDGLNIDEPTRRIRNYDFRYDSGSPDFPSEGINKKIWEDMSNIVGSRSSYIFGIRILKIRQTVYPL